MSNMEQYKGKQTPGAVTAESGAIRCPNDTVIARIWGSGVEYPGSEQGANTALYCEAHNLANESGLWPREMQERIKKLEEALDGLTLVIGLTPVVGNKQALQEAVDTARALLTTPSAIKS